MKKYTVVIHYEGAMTYMVEAQTEDEAEEMAQNLFGDEKAETLVAELADVEVCDCWEEE